MSELAWFDAAAIYLAVLIVSGFSAFVDWRKEKEFVKRSQDDEDKKDVSFAFIYALVTGKRQTFHVWLFLIANCNNSNCRCS